MLMDSHKAQSTYLQNLYKYSLKIKQSLPNFQPGLVMDIELVAQPSLIHYHKWVVQQVKVCIKDYTYKTLTSFGCLQFIITLWLPFCNINNDQKEAAGSGIQSRFVQCGGWSSSFILTATRHLLSLMLHVLGRHVQFGQSAQCGFRLHLPLLLSSYTLDYQNSCFQYSSVSSFSR